MYTLFEDRSVRPYGAYELLQHRQGIAELDMDDPCVKSNVFFIFPRIILSPSTYRSYNHNACLYGVSLPTFGTKMIRIKMDTWGRPAINQMITRISNASQQSNSEIVKKLQQAAKDRDRWDGQCDDFNLVFSLNWIDDQYHVLATMDGFFSSGSGCNFDLLLDIVSQNLMEQLYPCVHDGELAKKKDDIVERQVDVMEVCDGHDSFFCTVDQTECATGSFSSLVDLHVNLDQNKKDIYISNLVLETPRDNVVTSEIRLPSYYTSDYAWNKYVRHRSPRRLYEILSIMSQLPHGRVVAPCDGPGVVALSCKILGIDCLSTDINAGIARVMFEKVVKEDWTRTLQRTKMGDIIFLSHCEEMCPGIVQASLARGNMVVYYGKEPMFAAMEKMHQISLYLWSSHIISINIAPVQLASDFYFGKMLKYKYVGIVSEIALRNVRMLSLFSADSSFEFFGHKDKLDAFNSFLVLHGLNKGDKSTQAIVAYNANEIIRAFSTKPKNAVVIDMRIGKTYRNFPSFSHFNYWHTMKCHRRKIYEFLGNVVVIRGKGINIDYCDTGTSYTWFDKVGTWKLLLEGIGVIHRISVEVLD